jgi:hypothetical protein
MFQYHFAQHKSHMDWPLHKITLANQQKLRLIVGSSNLKRRYLDRTTSEKSVDITFFHHYSVICVIMFWLFFLVVSNPSLVQIPSGPTWMMSFPLVSVDYSYSDGFSWWLCRCTFHRNAQLWILNLRRSYMRMGKIMWSALHFVFTICHCQIEGEWDGYKPEFIQPEGIANDL